jgi:phosphoribosylaminoimidazole-succinocarboxamide synthase
MSQTITEVELTSVPLFARGKVRHSFDLGEQLLIVATDRISAFDVILPTAIPRKGAVLTRLSARWFEWTRSLQDNHYLTMDLSSLPLPLQEQHQVAGRSMVVRKATRIDVECVVRGYLAGSAWEEYRAGGTIHAEAAPPGLAKGARLPHARFTPAVKNDHGHDQNISRAELRKLIGAPLASALEQKSLVLYGAANSLAQQAGLLLADTKFEFGFVDGEVILIDELLTPDSSRFWDAASYQPGTEPSAFDKQIVRDWLLASGWNKQPPGPQLPDYIRDQTSARYREVERRIQAAMGGEEEGRVDR